jgi:hypothetical protein
MTKYLMLIVSLLILSISMAFGVEPMAVPGQSIADAISSFLSSPTGMVVVGAIVEFALRFVKSSKPLGVLHLVGGLLKVFGALAVKLGEFLDKVLPQNVAK